MDVMRAVQVLLETETEIRFEKDSYKKNQLRHKKAQLLRDIGREVQLRTLEGDTIIRINHSL